MHALPPADFALWRERARARMTALRQPGRSDAAEIVDGLLARLLPAGLASADQHVLIGEAGEVWFATGADRVVLDLDGEPQALLPVVHDAARAAGATEMKILLFPSQPALAAATAELGYRPLATRMRLRLTAEPRHGDRVVSLEPLGAAAAADFAEGLIASYAADLVSSGTAGDHDTALVTARQQTEEALAGPGSVTFAGIAGGRQVGTLWLDVSDAEAFVLDVVVAADQRGRGLGRALMVAAEDLARDRGCRSVALSVFGDNAVARRLYDALGYEVTETFLGVGL